MLPHLVRPFSASEIIPLRLSDVKGFFLEFLKVPAREIHYYLFACFTQ